LIFIQDRPKAPPNISYILKLKKTENYLRSIVNMMKNLHLVASLLSFSLIMGVSYTVSSVIQDLLPSSYTQFDVGMIGLAYLGTGIIGGFVGTIYLEFYSKGEVYDPLIKSLLFIGIGSLVALAAVIENSSPPVIYMLSALAGIGLISSGPFLIQSLIETTFPAQDTIPINIYQLAGNLLGIAGNYLATASFVGNKGLAALAVMLIPACFYVFTFFKTHYKRKMAEDENSKLYSVYFESSVLEKIEDDTDEVQAKHKEDEVAGAN